MLSILVDFIGPWTATPKFVDLSRHVLKAKCNAGASTTAETFRFKQTERSALGTVPAHSKDSKHPGDAHMLQPLQFNLSHNVTSQDISLLLISWCCVM